MESTSTTNPFFSKEDLEYEISKEIRKLNERYGSIYVKNWNKQDIQDIKTRLEDLNVKLDDIEKRISE